MEVFEVKPEEVSPKMRQTVKALNSDVIYRMSAYGFVQVVDGKNSKQLITQGEA